MSAGIVSTSGKSRRVNIGANDRVISVDTLAIAITCIADFIAHLQRHGCAGPVIQEGEKVMTLLAGESDA